MFNILVDIFENVYLVSKPNTSDLMLVQLVRIANYLTYLLVKLNIEF